MAVRSAAAEALGLLYQMCGLEALPDDDDELLSGNESDGSAGSGGQPRSAVHSSAAPAREGGSAKGRRQNGSCVSIDGSARNVSDDAAAALTDGFESVLHRVEDLAANMCAFAFLIVGKVVWALHEGDVSSVAFACI